MAASAAIACGFARCSKRPSCSIHPNRPLPGTDPGQSSAVVWAWLLPARSTGGCPCGNVRILASGTPYRVGLCHCLDCRKHHGALFHASAIFPEDAVTIDGEARDRPTAAGVGGRDIWWRSSQSPEMTLTGHRRNTPRHLLPLLLVHDVAHVRIQPPLRTWNSLGYGLAVGSDSPASRLSMRTTLKPCLANTSHRSYGYSPEPICSPKPAPSREVGPSPSQVIAWLMRKSPRSITGIPLSATRPAGPSTSRQSPAPRRAGPPSVSRPPPTSPPPSRRLHGHVPDLARGRRRQAYPILNS